MNNIVKLEIKDNIALITMDRPNARNAINIAMIDDFHEVLDLIEKNTNVRAAIITGSGNTFCSGGDLNLPLFEMDDMNERRIMINHIYRVPERIHKMPIPFIAAINGPAIGGGVTLAGFCDLRICTVSSYFILNYVNIGVLPDFGGCYFIPHILGRAKAMELALLGDKIDADQALNIGLVNFVVPDDEVIDKSFSVAEKIAGLPPLAVMNIKQSIYELQGLSMETALDKEAHRFNYLLGTNDCREAVKAFIEKRKPEYTGT